MPENEPKKPAGLRDISDLKARLGLKTGAMPSVVPPPTGAPIPPPGGLPFPVATNPTPVATPIAMNPTPHAAPSVVPPPIVAPPLGAGPNSRPVAAVPPPPGFAPPAPPPPDLRRDPFAQVAGMPAAPMAVPAYAPEFVVVGPPGETENLQKKTPASKILGRVALALAVFVVGYFLGRIWGARHEHNYAIEAAQKMLTQVEKMGQKRQGIIQALETSKARMAQKGEGGLPDTDLIADLEQLGFQAPDAHDLYVANYNMLDNEVVREVVDYYVFTERLALSLQGHIEKSKQDQNELEDYIKSVKPQAAAGATAGAAAQPAASQFGIVFDTTKPFSVGLLAEVGSPICKDSSQTDCAPQDMVGFQTRTSVGGAWEQRSPDLHAKDAERVVLLDKTTALFQSVLHGGPVVTAVTSYQRRSAEIGTYLLQLQQIQNDLKKKLGEAAGRPKEFNLDL